MEMTKIKWDESMGIRCMSIFKNNIVNTVVAPETIKPQSAASIVAENAAKPKLTVEDIQWKDFEKALNSAFKK